MRSDRGCSWGSRSGSRPEHRPGRPALGWLTDLREPRVGNTRYFSSPPVDANNRGCFSGQCSPGSPRHARETALFGPRSHYHRHRSLPSDWRGEEHETTSSEAPGSSSRGSHLVHISARAGGRRVFPSSLEPPSIQTTGLPSAANGACVRPLVPRERVTGRYLLVPLHPDDSRCDALSP